MHSHVMCTKCKCSEVIPRTKRQLKDVSGCAPIC